MFKINLFRVLSYCITSYTDTDSVLNALVKIHAKHQKQSNHKKHPRQLNEVHLHYLNLPMQSKPEKKKQRKKPSNKASQQKQQKQVSKAKQTNESKKQKEQKSLSQKNKQKSQTRRDNHMKW